MTVPIRGVTGYRAAPRAALDAFLTAPRLMRLGVTEPDGTPLVHPVWYTWQYDHFLVHLGTRSAKRRAIETQPIVYFTIDEARHRLWRARQGPEYAGSGGHPGAGGRAGAV